MSSTTANRKGTTYVYFAALCGISLCFYVYGSIHSGIFTVSKPCRMQSVVHIAQAQRTENLKQCEPFIVEPFNEEVVRFLQVTRQINCLKSFSKNASKIRKPAFAMVDGNVLVRLKDVGYPCCFESFDEMTKGKGNLLFTSNCRRINDNETTIEPPVEYLEVRCSKGAHIAYVDMFAVAHNKTINKSSSLDAEEKQKLNILIIGIDSTSQQNFHRKMPGSRSFLLNELSAVPLSRYNKVGYNTNPNAAALLTGHSYQELEDINATTKGTDELPFIWRDFSNKGYITASIEDCSVWPVLRKRFTLPPFHYDYMPITKYSKILSLGKPSNKDLEFCHGPRLTFTSMLNFAENVANMTKRHNQSFFQFLWTSKHSHASMNGVGRLDAPFLKALKRFRRSKLFNSTVLFVIGDHGYQLLKNNYSFTPSGEIEDRMPVAYVAVPKWFKRQFPIAYKNLRKNTNKVTTPYDIHQTLKDLLNLESIKNATNLGNDGTTSGISLFRKIPAERTCSDAKIPFQYCGHCFPKLRIPVSSSLAHEATSFFLGLINNLTEPHKSECDELRLHKIVVAFKMDARDVYTSVCQPGMYYGTSVSCHFTDPVEIVKVIFTTDSGDDQYHIGEAMKLTNGDWIKSENPSYEGTTPPNCFIDKRFSEYCRRCNGTNLGQ